MKDLLKKLGIHIHEWGKWYLELGTWNGFNGKSIEVSIQLRQCKSCGKLQKQDL